MVVSLSIASVFPLAVTIRGLLYLYERLSSLVLRLSINLLKILFFLFHFISLTLLGDEL